MGQEHNENLFPIHTPSILHGALVAVKLSLAKLYKV
jgi:hypothetical protein